MQRSIKDNDFWFWKVHNLDTDTDIRDVIFADDETCEYHQRVRDKDGKLIRDDNGVVVARMQGRIEFRHVPVFHFDNE